MKHIHNILSQLEVTSTTIFRGHSDHSWKLIPSIGRHFNQDWSTVKEKEVRSLSEFKKRSVPYIDIRPGSDIEWLCLMQHHGCPTRLLDFTRNPLIALFFASDPSNSNDGQFISTDYRREYAKVADSEVFNGTKAFAYHPPHITARIIGQSGCFVVSARPNAPLKGHNQKSIGIPFDQKHEIRRELAVLGITHSSMFPGVDGICLDLRDTLVSDLEFEEILS